MFCKVQKDSCRVSGLALITQLNKLLIDNEPSIEKIGLHLLAIYNAAFLLEAVDIHKLQIF
jgi:hypothetical protein